MGGDQDGGQHVGHAHLLTPNQVHAHAEDEEAADHRERREGLVGYERLKR